MNKAKNITLCAVCAALSVIAMAAMAIPGVKWFVLILAVVASVAIALPMLFDVKNIKFVLLAYIAASAIGIVAGMANITYVLPVVAFCMPFAIVKVYGESTYVVKNSVQKADVVSENPFDESTTDETQPAPPTECKDRISRKLRWLIYYALLEVGIALTLVIMWIATPDAFAKLFELPIFLIEMIAAAQLVVPLFNILLTSCLRSIAKVVTKFADR